MLIPIIKGTRELIESVKDGEIIQNGCPKCQRDLLLKQFRVWDTLFLIPIIPSNETRFVYECVDCYETFDPAYRNTYIHRAKYLNATEQEIDDLTDGLSLTMLSAILASDDRSIEKVVDVLKAFSVHYGIDVEAHKEKFDHEFLSREEQSKTVLEWYDIFRDCFSEEYRNKALHLVLEYSNLIKLSVKETKLLYIFGRHWGLTKSQFEELHKG